MSEELKVRIRWGLVAAVLLLGVVFFSGPEVTFLVAAALGLQAWREYARMFGLRKNPLFYLPGFILLLLIFTYAFFLGPRTYFWIWATWIVGFALLYIEARIKKELQITNIDRAWALLCQFVMGVSYIFLLFGFIGPIASRSNGEWVLFFSFVLVFTSDIGAYFVGKRWGSRKLWAALSPSKTVEGALGGWAASFVASLILWGICRLTIPGTLPLMSCLLAALVGAPLAQTGDMLESLMKRASGCKDSGRFIPGHGGILDRVDGFVFVMPLIYFIFS